MTFAGGGVVKYLLLAVDAKYYPAVREAAEAAIKSAFQLQGPVLFHEAEVAGKLLTPKEAANLEEVLDDIYDLADEYRDDDSLLGESARRVLNALERTGFVRQ